MFRLTEAVHDQHAHSHDGHGEAEQEAAVLSLRDLGHEDLVLGQVAEILLTVYRHLDVGGVARPRHAPQQPPRHQPREAGRRGHQNPGDTRG